MEKSPYYRELLEIQSVAPKFSKTAEERVGFEEKASGESEMSEIDGKAWRIMRHGRNFSPGLTFC